MSGGRGYVLAKWSELHSSFVSLMVWPASKRADLFGVAERLTLAGDHVSIRPVADVSSEALEEAACLEMKPPPGAFVVHPKGDPNA